MADCIFCKIVEGKIPSKKVFEDEMCLALLDVNPIVEGHTLVIPKKHFKDIFEIDEKTIGHMNEICKKVANLLKERLDVRAVNILNASGKEAQQSVFHIHYHVVPRRENDGLDLWFHGKRNGTIDLDKVFKKLSD